MRGVRVHATLLRLSAAINTCAKHGVSLYRVETVALYSICMEHQKIRPTYIIGPDGESLSLDRLPPPSTKRWIARKKAEVVAAVEGGLLTLDEALSRYSLSLEEFAAWRRWVERAGVPALRATKSQQYRVEWEQRDG